MLLPLLIAAADSAPHFTAGCLAERPAAICTCVVSALAGDAGGRYVLDMAELTALPEAEQMAGFAAVRARHGIASPEASTALLNRGKAVGDAAVARCK